MLRQIFGLPPNRVPHEQRDEDDLTASIFWAVVILYVLGVRVLFTGAIGFVYGAASGFVSMCLLIVFGAIRMSLSILMCIPWPVYVIIIYFAAHPMASFVKHCVDSVWMVAKRMFFPILERNEPLRDVVDRIIMRARRVPYYEQPPRLNRRNHGEPGRVHWAYYVLLFAIVFMVFWAYQPAPMPNQAPQRPPSPGASYIEYPPYSDDTPPPPSGGGGDASMPPPSTGGGENMPPPSSAGGGEMPDPSSSCKTPPPSGPLIEGPSGNNDETPPMKEPEMPPVPVERLEPPKPGPQSQPTPQVPLVGPSGGVFLDPAAIMQKVLEYIYGSTVAPVVSYIAQKYRNLEAYATFRDVVYQIEPPKPVDQAVATPARPVIIKIYKYARGASETVPEKKKELPALPPPSSVKVLWVSNDPERTPLNYKMVELPRKLPTK